MAQGGDFSWLWGALAGALTGYGATFAHTKSIGRVQAIRDELRRLDEMIDDCQTVAASVRSGAQPDTGTLQIIDMQRIRLEQNLQRLGYGQHGWDRIEQRIQQLDALVGRLQEPVVGQSDWGAPSARDLVYASEQVRLAVGKSSRQFWTWMLHGER